MLNWRKDTHMPRTLAAVFPDRREAEEALADAQAHASITDFQVYSTPKPALATGSRTERTSKSVLGAVIGSLIVGSIGAIIGWISAVVAAGTTSSVTFAVVAVSCAGGMVGWLLGGLAYPGTPVEEDEYYQEWVEQGRSVLALNAPGREQEVQQILARHGAQSIQAAPTRRVWGGFRGRAPRQDRTREPRGTALT